MLRFILGSTKSVNCLVGKQPTAVGGGGGLAMLVRRYANHSTRVWQPVRYREQFQAQGDGTDT